MRKRRISQATVERALLTEVAPYETPVFFSNWGSYNYFRALRTSSKSRYLTQLFESNVSGPIPFKFRILKSSSSTRVLYLIHPKISSDVIQLYRSYATAILKACRRSTNTLRAPYRVAKFFNASGATGTYSKKIEEVLSDTPYASSFFAYRHFSHLHKFFESEIYGDLEKRYAFMAHLDIAKCFPSIYTHTISWAIRGKTQAKEDLQERKKDKKRSLTKSFDGAFDSLVQKCNYYETNGIPIGPEFSRIFAEIILQKIDIDTVNVAATDRGLAEGRDYSFFRYIDDYYVFFNSEDVFQQWKSCLCVQLEKFRLYLAAEKAEITERPFITPLSILKISISDYIRELFDRFPGITSRESTREINRFRATIKNHKGTISGVSTFALSAIEKRISAFETTSANLFDQLYVAFELATIVMRMDMRVACCFRWMRIVIRITDHASTLPCPQTIALRGRVARELRSAIDSAFDVGGIIEGLNLLILAADQFRDTCLDLEIIESIILRCKENHNDEYSKSKRLNYFEIVALLFAVRDDTRFLECRRSLLEMATACLVAYDSRSYSETAHLLLDLLSCPWLTDAEKEGLVTASLTPTGEPVIPAEVTTFVEEAKHKDWYFNWNGRDHLLIHLKKKDLLLSY